jgi:ankyrin repeat protein
MNFKKLRNFIALCVILNATLGYAGRDYYQRNRPACGAHATVADLKTVDPRFEPKVNYNQGNFGTCYGFASYYALQYFYNKSNKLPSASEPLSILDVLGKGCRKEWQVDGGRSYSVLHNLRQEELSRVALESYPAKYSTVLQNAKSLKDFHGRPESCGECCEFLNNNILTKPAMGSVDYSKMLKIVSQEQQKGTSDTFPYRVIDELNSGKKVQLPAYNVYRYQSDRSKDHLEKVRALFSDPHNSSPVIMSFCTKEKAPGVCEDDSYHATAITGVRKTCCSGRCTEEWFINNSYGANVSVNQPGGAEHSEHGWHSAEDLAASMATYSSSMGLTYISPCSPKYVPNLPICTNYVHAKDPRGNLINTRDRESRELFEKNKPDPRLQTDWTPFEAAVANGDLDTVNYFLDLNTDVERLTPAGLSPLAIAVDRNDLNITKLLLKAGADPNEKIGNTPSPLQIALLQKNSKTKDILLSHMALQKKPENKFDSGGWTDLTRAARDGDVAGVLGLVTRGVDIDFANSKGWSALNIAAFKGHAEIVKLLLNHQASPNSKSFSGYTPLWAASLVGNTEVSQLLVEAGAELNEQGKDGLTPLNVAAANGKLEIVDFLMARNGVDLNAQDTSGLAPLHHAAHQNYSEVINSLIKGKNIDLDIRTRSGHTPLMLAMLKNNDLIVRKLLKAGADPTLIGYDGQSPWRIAAGKKLESRTIQVLQESIDRIYNRFDHNGETPLSIAAKSGNFENLKSLVKKGASLDFQNSKGKQPLFIAAAEGHEEVVKFLLEQGADPNKKSQNGFTALMVPVLSGNASIVSLLAPKMKKEINSSGADKMTALHHASALGDSKVVQILLDSGASVSEKNVQGLTPLLIAILTGKTEVVKILAESKKSVLNSDTGQSVPLEQAIKKGNIEMVKILLKAGANGKSSEAMAVARRLGNREILDLISQ